jgi:hypothetical protein
MSPIKFHAFRQVQTSGSEGVDGLNPCGGLVVSPNSKNPNGRYSLPQQAKRERGTTLLNIYGPTKPKDLTSGPILSQLLWERRFRLWFLRHRLWVRLIPSHVHSAHLLFLGRQALEHFRCACTGDTRPTTFPQTLRRWHLVLPSVTCHSCTETAKHCTVRW